MKHFWEGLFKKNPVFVLALGLVPAVAVTTTAHNGLALGLVTTIVLLLATLINHFVNEVMPDSARLPMKTLVMIIVVVVAYGVLLSQSPSLVARLSIFLPLIAAGDLLLRNRQEDDNLGTSLARVLGQGLGFTLALLIIGVIREFLAVGAFFGQQVLTGELAPMSIASSVPGGLIIVGLLMAIVNKTTKQGGESHD